LARPISPEPRCRQSKKECDGTKVFFAGLLLIEALDDKSLRSALRKAAEIAPDVLGDVSDPEIYQSIFALDARIAWV